MAAVAPVPARRASAACWHWQRLQLGMGSWQREADGQAAQRRRRCRAQQACGGFAGRLVSLLQHSTGRWSACTRLGGGSSTFTPGSAYCRHTELTLAFSSTLSVSVAQTAWLEPGWAPKSERRLMQERPPRAGPSAPPAASQAAALVTAAGGVRPGRPAAPPSLQATRIPPARRPELFWRACRMQQTTALTARLCRPLLCHRPAGRRLCRSAAAATTTPQASRPGCIPS